jgi:hypothetical protein
MRKDSCAVFSKEHSNSKVILEMIAKAPIFFNKSVLEYLGTEFEDSEKKILPRTLNEMNDDVLLQEKLFRLRYIIQYWELGPETKFDDV